MQLLEISLQANGDDCHIIRSVQIMDKMVSAFIKADQAFRNANQRSRLLSGEAAALPCHI